MQPLATCASLQHAPLSLPICKYSLHGKSSTTVPVYPWKGKNTRDIPGKRKTPAGHKRRDSGKHRTPEDIQVHCATQTLSGETSSPIAINRRKRMNTSSLLSAHPSNAMQYQGYAMEDFATFIFNCARCSSASLNWHFSNKTLLS